MRKLYVPIMVNPEHSTDIYYDDFKKLGVKHVFFAECLRFVNASGERYERAIEYTKRAVQKYEALGFDCGAWISTLGYGGTVASPGTNSTDFTSIRSITGKTSGSGIAVCATDKEVLSRACRTVKDLARAGVKMIMLDDDLCLSVRPGLSCTCDNHLNTFSRRVGRKVSLEELPELVFTGKANKYRSEWLKAQGDALRDFCKALRDAVDEVDPNVRMGFCAGYTSFDVEGVDAIELTYILAGKTKPFLRFTSAPYWLQCQRFGQTPLATYIELARIQAAWVKGTDIEVFTECDTYPHDRYHTPVSHVQCFDSATMLTPDVGVLKYFYHYPCKPETERGYINAHLDANTIANDMQKAFHGKDEVGVRVYEQMRKLQDATLPDHFDRDTSEDFIMRKYSFSEAQMMLSINAIPTVYDGKGVCGIAFGQNASYLDEQAFEKGLILDVSAAEILQAKGIDVGLRSTKPLGMTCLEDFGFGTPVSVAWSCDLCEIEISDKAQVLSRFVDTDFIKEEKKSVPAAYLYENENGNRFLVYAFRSERQPVNSGMYLNYHRGQQIADAIAWLGSEPLPVTCNGHPFGYLRCNRDDKTVAAAYFNCTPDGIDKLEFKFAGAIKNAKVIGGVGEKTSDNTVTVSDVRGYGYVTVVAEI